KGRWEHHHARAMRTCRVAAVSGLPGRDSASCQRDEQDARGKLEKDWCQYSAAQRNKCDGLVTTGGAPSYLELLTCLEMAKQAKELPEDSKMGERWPPLIVKTWRAIKHRQTFSAAARLAPDFPKRLRAHGGISHRVCDRGVA